jgi:hypothetical protein
MLKFVNSSLTRSLAVMALIGGVGLWNYVSSANGTCFNKCWKSRHVDVWYRTPCVCGHRELPAGEYSLVSFPEGDSPNTPECITWLGWCTSPHPTSVGRDKTPTVLTCIAFYDPNGRACPCAGCGVAHCCTFCHLSNASQTCLPTGCPVYWIQTCAGRCVYDG